MTVKNAIQILDWWIEQKKLGMDKLKKDWNYSDDDGIAKTLLDVDSTILENLQLIRNELVPKCKHTKKMIDRMSNGQQYCMNCNFDL
jgi:hypothetical protein